jgi:hypothetical protein
MAGQETLDPELSAILKNIGVFSQRVVDAFLQNEINVESFYSLTLEDLKEMKLPVGPRGLILKEINRKNSLNTGNLPTFSSKILTLFLIFLI